jgi:protein SCO1
MTNWRLTIAGIVLVAVIGMFAGGWLYTSRSGGSGGGSVASVERPVGQFMLVDQDNVAVDQRLLRGKWSAVFFGYTYCPDFCPLTLQSLAQTQTLMGPRAKDMQIVFISVDPARDTPKALKTYLQSGGFPKGVRGLTGTEPAVAKAAKAFGASYEKSGSGDTYTMNHTAYVFLIGPDGRFRLPLSYGLSPEQSAEMIIRTMDEERRAAN